MKRAKEKEYLEAIEDARQCGYLSGKREVVEWLKERVFDIDAPIPVGDRIYARFREPLLQVELQAKLKEWGIKK